MTVTRGDGSQCAPCASHYEQQGPLIAEHSPPAGARFEHGHLAEPSETQARTRSR